MHLLHISSDYPFSPLYRQMLIGLADAGVNSQTMYVPTRIGQDVVLRPEPPVPGVSVIHSRDFRNIERPLYWGKMLRIAARIERSVDISSVDLMHAHYLFSGGGVARRLSKRHPVPYVVSVRSTDVNVFFQKMIHLRSLGVRIMMDAQRVIFLSGAYRDQVIDRYVPRRLRSAIRSKSVVVPNGIDPFWFQDKPPMAGKLIQNRPVRLLYVGQLVPRKNVLSIVRSLTLLQKRNLAARLTIVGEGPQAEQIDKAIARSSATIERKPWTSSRAQLLDYYRSTDIFVMASRDETFGLVYLEAMSQAVPVVYSRGQGIDGHFSVGEVGFSVTPGDSEEIADAVERIVRSDYGALSSRALERSLGFQWDGISRQLASIYQDCVSVQSDSPWE